MTRIADRIAAKVVDLRPKVKRLYPDWCEVVRATAVPDGRGGQTTVETVVEADYCLLAVSERSGIERTSGDRLTGISVYTCDLPWSSLLTDTDILRVNGREFAVTSVGFAEGFEIGKTALLEART